MHTVGAARSSLPLSPSLSPSPSLSLSLPLPYFFSLSLSRRVHDPFIPSLIRHVFRDPPPPLLLHCRSKVAFADPDLTSKLSDDDNDTVDRKIDEFSEYLVNNEVLIKF